MFNLWQNCITQPQETTEPALYAVAFPIETSVPIGGIRPQGQYLASPLSAPECVVAKQDLADAEPSVNYLTGTSASVTQGLEASQPMLRSFAPMSEFAGRTGSAFLITGVSLRENDGNRLHRNANAVGASADRSTWLLSVLHG